MPGQGGKREATPYHDSGKKQKSETLCPTLGLSFRLRTESEAEADLHKYKYALNEVAKGEDPFHECEEELEEYKQVCSFAKVRCSCHGRPRGADLGLQALSGRGNAGA